jgi:hypothetical protein
LIDPEAFATDAKLRPTPFPGLSAFGDEDADAAPFYGPSREIAHHCLKDCASIRLKTALVSETVPAVRVPEKRGSESASSK